MWILRPVRKNALYQWTLLCKVTERLDPLVNATVDVTVCVSKSCKSLVCSKCIQENLNRYWLVLQQTSHDSHGSYALVRVTRIAL